MIDAEETKRKKAKALRYKKPIVKDLNLDTIMSNLCDIQSDCEEVHWYTDSDDGEDSLLNALDGDADEAYEFKMLFADLCADCERMYEDLRDTWVPDCFDILFVAVLPDSDLLGWDSYEGDYYGLDFKDSFAVDEAYRQLMAMTKKDIISAVRQCMKVYTAYIGLQNRYDSLKAAIDILKDKNTGYLQVIKEIERLYDECDKSGDKWTEYLKTNMEFKRYTSALPPEAWLQ